MKIPEKRRLYEKSNSIVVGGGIGYDGRSRDGAGRGAAQFDDIVGLWNINYENGETGTFTMSKKDDGTPKIMATTDFGESEARDIVIEGDAITFHREANPAGPLGEPLSLSIEYTAKLVDGKLEGTGEVTGLPAASSPFAATRAE